MATSASSDYNPNRNAIISRAARIIGAIKAGETMGAQEVTDFSDALNAMVKAWVASPNMRVWTVSEATLFPQVNQVKYALASGGADHATETHYSTTLSAAAAAGATTLTVASTANMTVSDYIGIVLTSGTIHWTTLSSKTSTTVTIASGLATAAASGKYVFNYTTKIVRPLKITDARLYNIAGGTETSLGPMTARLDYRNLSSKTQTGNINQVFYDPQLATGYLYLWQPVSSVQDLVKFTWHRPIMDFDSAANTADLPQEWIRAIVWNLADEMQDEYDVPEPKSSRISARASGYLADVGGFDREAESIYLGADVYP